MRLLVLVLLLACGKSDAPTGPFGVLRDPSQAWLYELVHGESVDKLAPVAGAPTIKCRIFRDKSEARGPDEHSTIRCSSTAQTAGADGFFLQAFLVFEEHQVREIVGPGSFGPEYALAFTFPTKLDPSATWGYDHKGYSVHSHVEVRTGSMNVLGEQRPVVISTSSYSTSFDEENGGPTLGAAIYAPGVAPVMLCEVKRKPTIAYTCARLLERAPKPPKRPGFNARFPSEQAKADLVKFLKTMDHEPDLFGDLLEGKLVVRDDIPPTEAAFRSVIVIEPAAYSFQGTTYDLAGLRTRLGEAQAKLVEAIEQGKIARREDPVGFREQINVAIDASASWKHIVDGIDAAAAAGFVQPAFVFARTPNVARPPKLWMEDVIKEEALDGNGATFLADQIKRILAQCEPLRAAFGASDSGAVSIAERVIEQLAEAIPKTHCRYDIDAFRWVLWATLGTPYPHSVIATKIDPSGEPLELPAAMPWREASAKLRPDMPALHFVAR